jgi:hypothetical protein
LLKLSTEQGIQNAKKERNNATKIWFVLVVLTSSLTIFYYTKGSKEIVKTKRGGGEDT